MAVWDWDALDDWFCALGVTWNGYYHTLHQPEPEPDEHEGGKCVIYNNQSKMCSSVSMPIDLQHNVSFVCMHC